ncbi:MAG TPA: A/G-specific adenine glycosylase [Actinomycetales bacterium]|nr:A/G-specific adenine glycosylase [Actinomycetales bacterium]
MTSDALHRPVLDWYATKQRVLPWRAPDRTAWGVLVSEVMLQQTPVSRVLPVWQAWMRRWPDAVSLAGEPAGEAVRAWGRLGYPRRALRLHAAATAIRDEHEGQVPSTYEQLLSLPGIGDYTAAAVASFAFGARHVVLDTNVRRVLSRAVSGEAQPPRSLTVAERRLAESLLPDDDAPTWAVAVMELGALVCTARAARCLECPLTSLCAWRSAGSPTSDQAGRRTQPWHGTDRQVRGRLLAVARAADPGQAVDHGQLATAVPDDELRDPRQRERCLASLVEDGLLEQCGSDRYRLPT